MVSSSTPRRSWLLLTQIRPTRRFRACLPRIRTTPWGSSIPARVRWSGRSQTTGQENLKAIDSRYLALCRILRIELPYSPQRNSRRDELQSVGKADRRAARGQPRHE
jgi:hypothetical protein